MNTKHEYGFNSYDLNIISCALKHYLLNLEKLEGFPFHDSQRLNFEVSSTQDQVKYLLRRVEEALAKDF